ncbi:uncharacterized protein LOC119828681 [Zerene cesonia]|uniref:uncharacterized protein LOC119828681 n=1 Tax=Zerene cesonia TaxID=33412 RepID=UPI0018E58DD9|nr:uncharacterized protein LOC119828681 [Zerene cesonia]
MIYRWWHQFVRKRTKPIPEDIAQIWKTRLSFAYGFFAWNAFGLMVYCLYQGKADWAHYYGLKSDEEKSMSPGLYILYNLIVLKIMCDLIWDRGPSR